MPRAQTSCPAAETSVVASLRCVLGHALFSTGSSAFLKFRSYPAYRRANVQVKQKRIGGRRQRYVVDLQSELIQGSGRALDGAALAANTTKTYSSR